MKPFLIIYEQGGRPGLLGYRAHMVVRSSSLASAFSSAVEARPWLVCREVFAIIDLEDWEETMSVAVQCGGDSNLFSSAGVPTPSKNFVERV